MLASVLNYVLNYVLTSVLIYVLTSVLTSAAALLHVLGWAPGALTLLKRRFQCKRLLAWTSCMSRGRCQTEQLVALHSVLMVLAQQRHQLCRPAQARAAIATAWLLILNYRQQDRQSHMFYGSTGVHHADVSGTTADRVCLIENGGSSALAHPNNCDVVGC